MGYTATLSALQASPLRTEIASVMRGFFGAMLAKSLLALLFSGLESEESCNSV